VHHQEKPWNNDDLLRFRGDRKPRYLSGAGSGGRAIEPPGAILGPPTRRARPRAGGGAITWPALLWERIVGTRGKLVEHFVLRFACLFLPTVCASSVTWGRLCYSLWVE